MANFVHHAPSGEAMKPKAATPKHFILILLWGQRAQLSFLAEEVILVLVWTSPCGTSPVVLVTSLAI